MSKVVFKLTFKHPNFKDTKGKNVGHLFYIATRSGVDKTVTEADLKNELEKNIEEASDKLDNDENEIYSKYIDERPGSHGLFGKDGIENLQEVQKELRDVDSFVWRGIISIKEEDAKEIGYTDKSKWEDMLRSEMPSMAEKMGIKTSNLRWVAAIHAAQGHPHAHIMFWEKEPERKIGIVKPKVLDDIRKMYTDEMFEDQRLILLNEKNLMRDLLRDLAKNDMSKITNLIKEVRSEAEEIENMIGNNKEDGVPPKLYSEEERFLIEKIENLAKLMPGKGRTALKFMPEEVKEEVRSVADYLLEQPVFSASLEKNLNAVDGLTRMYTSDDKSVKSKKKGYEYVVNNVANVLDSYDVEKEEIIKILKKWTEDQEIDLKDEDKDKILSEIKFDGKLDDKNKKYLNILSIKMFEEKTEYLYDRFLRDKYVKNEINQRGGLIEDLVRGDLLEVEDGKYEITEKGSLIINLNNKLSEVEKGIVDIFNTSKENTIEELLQDTRLLKLLKSGNENQFQLGKYDATILKSYFGKENSFNFEKFKTTLLKKFKSQNKRENEYTIVKNRIGKLVRNGIIQKNEDGTYEFTHKGLEELESIDTTFKYTSFDANVVSEYIKRAGGELTEDQLKKFLFEDYKDPDEVERQFKYLIRRLDKNVNSNYMQKKVENDVVSYSITQKGIDEKQKIADPEGFQLKKALLELKDLDILHEEDGKYSFNDDFEGINNKILLQINNGSYDTAGAEEENKKIIDDAAEDLDNMDVSYKKIKEDLNIKETADPIKKARDNAYKDIRDRICQIILKSAVESMKDNIFYVDKELSEKAVEFIRNIDNKINTIPEHVKVFHEIAIALVKAGHEDEEISKILKKFTENEGIEYPKENIDNLVRYIRESDTETSIEFNSDKKRIDYYLSVAKLSGNEEEKAFDMVRTIINKEGMELNKDLNKLVEEGYFKKNGEVYNLTDKGIEEFLKVKKLDVSEKNIFNLLRDNDMLGATSFEELVKNNNIIDNLIDKDPEEFKLTRYDMKVRDEFGEENLLKFEELEQKIYEKYTDEEMNIDDKAEVEIELLEKRIKNLTLNGHIKFNKEFGEYSFTEETNSYFKYDEESDSYSYTDEAMEELEIKEMEFTRYDANVTLKYIDDADNNVLTKDELKKVLNKEIVNQGAKKLYEKFKSILQLEPTKKYVSLNEKGELTTTNEGKNLSRSFSNLNKYFYKCKGKITEEKIKKICIEEFGQQAKSKFLVIMNNLNKLAAAGHIKLDSKTGVYSVEPVIDYTNKLMYQIYKEGGNILKDNLKSVLEKNIPNRQAENQFKYLIKRMDFLKKEGYLSETTEGIKITDKGHEKKEDILNPQRSVLKKKLEYLEKLGLIDKIEGAGYKIAEKYFKYVSNIEAAKEEKREITSVFTDKIRNIIDRTQDRTDINKIIRGNMRIITGKYINNEYEDVKADYDSIRNSSKVVNMVEKTINKLSTVLLAAGVGIEEVKQMVQEWNIKSKSNIDIEKINSIIDKAHELVTENNTWNKVTVISSKDWKEMFKNLGINDNDMPKWMYKGENWEQFFKHNIGYSSLANEIWKAAWNQLERERMQTQAQAEYMKRNMIKEQAAAQNKSAMIEQSRKNKDRGNLYRDDELEL